MTWLWIVLLMHCNANQFSGDWLGGITDSQLVLWMCERGKESTYHQNILLISLCESHNSLFCIPDSAAKPKAYGCLGCWTCSKEKFDQKWVITPSWVAWFPQAEAT